jgi:hypothetical protein
MDESGVYMGSDSFDGSPGREPDESGDSVDPRFIKGLLRYLKIGDGFEKAGLTKEEGLVCLLLNVAADTIGASAPVGGDTTEILKNIGVAQRLIMARVGNRRFQKELGAPRGGRGGTGSASVEGLAEPPRRDVDWVKKEDEGKPFDKEVS